MNRLRTVLILAGFAMLIPIAVFAAPGDGLLGTAHDFSGISAAGGNGETFTTGLCTFCHTPHRGLSTLLLWNHTLSKATYSWDVPSTTAGTTFPSFKGDTYPGPTAKCLSCHDGSVAIGDVAWFGEGKPLNPLDTTKHVFPDPFNVGNATVQNGVLLGSLMGNHPVAMPYPIGVANTYNGVTNGSNLNILEFQQDPTANNIVLYAMTGSSVTRVLSSPSGTNNGIECSSCHDPHNKASKDDLFLRAKLGGSDTTYICLACHKK